MKNILDLLAVYFIAVTLIICNKKLPDFENGF